MTGQQWFWKKGRHYHSHKSNVNISEYPYICGYIYEFCWYYIKYTLCLKLYFKLYLLYENWFDGNGEFEKKMDILYENWFDGNGEFEKQLKIDKSCLS